MTDQIHRCCRNGALFFAAVVGIWLLTKVEGLVSHHSGVVGASVPMWKTLLLSVLGRGMELLTVPENQMQDLASHYYACRILSIPATRGFTSLWDGDRQPFFSSQEEGKNSF